MKKVLLASAFAVGIITASFAQTTTKESKQISHKTTVTAKQPKATATSAKSDTTKPMVKTKSSSSKKRHTK